MAYFRKLENENIIEEFEKIIIAEIDFEKKWLVNVKMENGYISIADIEIAMSRIKSVVADLKGDSSK